MTNEEFAVKLAETESRSKSNMHRIEKLEQETTAIQSLAQSVAVMASQQEGIGKKVDTIDKKVDALEAKPAEKWDKLLDLLIAAVVGAFLAWVAGL